MRIDDETCYRALAARDARFDGLFFVGVTSTRNLLPPDLHGADGGPRPVPVFLQLRPGGARGISTLPAVPARAGSGTCSGGCGLANRAGGRSPDRSGCLERWGEPGTIGPRPGAQHAAAAPRGPAGVRRLAGRAGPDPALAPGQAIAHRVESADHPGRVCERVRERAPIQCAFSLALPPHARRGCGARRPTSQAGDCVRLTLAYRPPLAWTRLDAIPRGTGDGGSRSGRRSGLLAGRPPSAVIRDGSGSSRSPDETPCRSSWRRRSCRPCRRSSPA